MSKTFQFSPGDLATLITLMPSPVKEKRRRRGFSYDGKTLTVEDDAEVAKILKIMSDPQWRHAARIAQLKGHAAYARYRKEIAGTVVNGMPIPTDRESQARIAALQLLAMNADPSTLFHWKKADGNFAQLPPFQVVEIGKAVTKYVQACYAAEAKMGAAISGNPDTMTEANIDAAFAAIR